MAGRKVIKKKKEEENGATSNPVEATNNVTTNKQEADPVANEATVKDPSITKKETQVKPDTKENKKRGKKAVTKVKKVSVKEHSLSDSEKEAMLKKGKLIMEKLEELYPEAPKGFLDHTNEFTLLIAVLLSAQSLDVKVNAMTPELFKLGDNPEAMKSLGEARIHSLIKEIGLAPQKSKNIMKLCEMLCNEYDGKVPATFEDLEKLPGVGHKTASVVMMQAFNKPAFPVDTHIHRLACRWGCGDAKSVDKTEASLKEWFPNPDTWAELHIRIILFGREHCPARKHDMDQCPICCFAATDEAKAANGGTKFVAPATHKNPYSIRDVAPVSNDKDEKEDKTFTPVETTKNEKTKRVKKMTAKATAAKKEKDNEPVKKQGQKRSAVTRKASEITANEDMVEERPAKRVKLDKTVTKSTVEEAKAVAPKKRGRARKKTEPENNTKTKPVKVKKVVNDEIPGVRKSSRLREKANRRLQAE